MKTLEAKAAEAAAGTLPESDSFNELLSVPDSTMSQLVNAVNGRNMSSFQDFFDNNPTILNAFQEQLYGAADEAYSINTYSDTFKSLVTENVLYQSNQSTDPLQAWADSYNQVSAKIETCITAASNAGQTVTGDNILDNAYRISYNTGHYTELTTVPAEDILGNIDTLTANYNNIASSNNGPVIDGPVIGGKGTQTNNDEPINISGSGQTTLTSSEIAGLDLVATGAYNQLEQAAKTDPVAVEQRMEAEATTIEAEVATDEAKGEAVSAETQAEITEYNAAAKDIDPSGDNVPEIEV